MAWQFGASCISSGVAAPFSFPSGLAKECLTGPSWVDQWKLGVLLMGKVGNGWEGRKEGRKVAKSPSPSFQLGLGPPWPAPAFARLVT